MFVMVLYFEPQILYGMTRPTKMQRCQASSYQWKADTARQSLPTLLYGGFIKWHHTAVRDNHEKNKGASFTQQTPPRRWETLGEST